MAGKLDFDGTYRVGVNGFAGGVWVLSNSSLWNVNIISSTT